MKFPVYPLAAVTLAMASLIAPPLAQAKALYEPPLISTAPPSPDDKAALVADAGAFDAARSRSDCTAGLPAARRLVANRLFAKTPADIQLTVWSVAAICSAAQNNSAETFADAEAATQLPGAGDYVWALRVASAVDLNRPDAVVETVEAAAATRPAALSKIKPDVFAEFGRDQLKAGARDDARRVFTALEKAGFTSSYPAVAADGVWLQDADLAVEAGDARHAAALLGRLDYAWALMDAKLDGRFADAVAAQPARFDLKAAVARNLDHDRAIVAANPNLLAAVNLVLFDLRALGRFDEALAMAQAALDRAGNPTPAQPAFTDQAEQLNWTSDAKAFVLLDLGRADEAVDLERRAAGLAENGHPGNVSQTINLAGFLNATGRADETLKALQVFDQGRGASPYGQAWVHAERACAYQQLGRGTELAGELAYLAAHEADNPGARLKALLCANDTAGAAALLIGRLHNPEDRGQALVDLSRFDPPAHATPFAAALTARLAAVAARPDVQAAIAQAGHVETIPLNGEVFSDAF
jgi:tetratricopeptide (TPR) repeat protein